MMSASVHLHVDHLLSRIILKQNMKKDEMPYISQVVQKNRTRQMIYEENCCKELAHVIIEAGKS